MGFFTALKIPSRQTAQNIPHKAENHTHRLTVKKDIKLAAL